MRFIATSLFRVNARPRKPIAIKIVPAIISQWVHRRKQGHLFPLCPQPDLGKPSFFPRPSKEPFSLAPVLYQRNA